MKILITGCCGHLGSYFIRNLPNHEIVGIDNMLTQRYCSLFHLPQNVTFLEKNFNDLTTEEIQEHDVLIHLAAITDAASSFGNTERIERINIEYTKKLIDKINQTNTRLVFPSSTSVYGTNEEVMYEYSEVNPQSPYAESKIKIERYIKINCKNDYVIFRFGTIFGVSPGWRNHTAINKFCYLSAFNKPLTIWRENYEMVRPYLYIGDALDAINLLLNKENKWYKTYNALTGNYKLSDIVKLIRKIKDTDVRFVDTPLLNQYSYDVSDDKIRELGYIPQGNLEEEIRKTLQLLGVKS